MGSDRGKSKVIYTPSFIEGQMLLYVALSIFLRTFHSGYIRLASKCCLPITIIDLDTYKGNLEAKRKQAKILK